MGMTPAMFNKIKSHLPENFNSIIELGCQQFGLLNSAQLIDEELKGFKDGDFTKIMYEHLGLKYDSVDVCDGTIYCDFNNHMLELSHQYDVVTNLGTSEHVFNQYNVFASMHNITKKNGLMIHCLPLKHSPHGLFTYNVDFFISLCFSNNYEVVELVFCWRGTDGDFTFGSLSEIVKCQAAEQYAFLVAKKCQENLFVSPQQIIYNPLISIDAITTLCSNDINLLSQVLQFTFTDAVLNHTFNFDDVTGNYPDVMLYGAGDIGQAILRFAKNREKIKTVVDENLKFSDDYNIKRLSDIEAINVPVYIASDYYREEIRQTLSMKYSEEIVFLN
ncbi:hypothetical protein G114_16380 [Aeromonas diversa CDC 2478-85]|uniref:Uncharacterized protein n=1 Tax=Aeromonas diversa CDC 2478-85 TaxID=1268237 RepID=N9VGQ7_9GAMM|nr:hypothetical protein [Aeromonas diversa]ENY70798.1 hypothetical protein G114_16380 [Aeromonas diversa CDC 2478-85]